MKPLRARFSKEFERKAEAYAASIPFDKRLYKEDIKGSIAHARALAKAGVYFIHER